MKQSYLVLMLAMVASVLLTACGSPMAGTYVPSAHLQEGATPSEDPEYTPEAIDARLREEGRRVTLNADGTFVVQMEDGTRGGRYRVEDGYLILRDTEYKGNRILPELQDDRRYEIRGHAFVDASVYGYHGVDLLYEPQ